MGGVNPELVGTSGQRRELYPGRGALNAKSVPAGATHFAMNRIEYLPRSIVHIETIGQVNFAACCLDDSFDNSGIFFYDCPSFELR